MACEDHYFKALELRKKLRGRVDELRKRVEKSASEAFERVYHERMDTYFAQQDRLEEMELLLLQIPEEITRTQDLDGLKRLSNRLNFLEDHFDEIDSKMYNRPARPRYGRFNLFSFLRQWTGQFSNGSSDEIMSEDEAFRELEVEPGSSLKTVKAAFRRLIKELHPDVRGGDRSTEPKLRKLVAAYESIKKRAAARKTFTAS